MAADRLNEAAGAIADGTATDWTALESSSQPDERPLLDALRVIEAVARTHRDAAIDAARRWGPFELENELGRGSFGTVYRAYDPHLARHVALKLLDAPVLPGAPSVAVEEGRLLARVRHANVITVFGADVLDGRAGLWMELIEGRTLEAILGADGPFGPSETAVIGRQLCSALAAVHACGLLHGDVTARNVMREAGGRVVLMDFGAGHDNAAHGGSNRGVAGTPMYVAPEVLAGSRPDPASDVYALGVLLFHLVTGGYPIVARSLDDVVAAHADGHVPVSPRPAGRRP